MAEIFERGLYLQHRIIAKGHRKFPALYHPVHTGTSKCWQVAEHAEHISVDLGQINLLETFETTYGGGSRNRFSWKPAVVEASKFQDLWKSFLVAGASNPQDLHIRTMRLKK